MNRFWFLRPGGLWKALIGFVQDWWFSRNFSTLIGAIPAALVLAAAVFVVGYGAATDKAQLIRHYSQARQSALEKADFELVALSLRKLSLLEPENLQHRYMQGLIAERNEDHPKARQIMRSLAPLEAPKYAPAHVWLAADLMKAEDDLDAMRSQTIKRHLLLAVAADPRQVQSHALLGQIYLREKRFDRAAAHIAQTVAVTPAARMQLANIYALMGKTDVARKEAELAASYYAHLVGLDSKNVDARLQWGGALVFLETFETTAAILQDGLELTGDDRFRKSLAYTYLVWSDHTRLSDSKRRFELLQQSITLAPDNPIALERLGAFAVKDDPHREQARRQLNALLDQGKAPATIHFIFGSIALQEGDMQQGLTHLEKAHEHDPSMPAITNNLAWTLAHLDQPQLDRALQLADAAVQVAPTNAEVRETRGLINIKLANWEAAIKDLQLARHAFPVRPSIHRGLAEAYEQLGQTELAAKHSKVAQTAAPADKSTTKPVGPGDSSPEGTEPVGDYR